MEASHPKHQVPKLQDLRGLGGIPKGIRGFRDWDLGGLGSEGVL